MWSKHGPPKTEKKQLYIGPHTKIGPVYWKGYLNQKHCSQKCLNEIKNDKVRFEIKH